MAINPAIIFFENYLIFLYNFIVGIFILKGGINLKTAIIDQILQGRTYPTQKIFDVISGVIVTPFIKLSDKTILSDDDGTATRIMEYYCPECKKTFKINSDCSYEAQCPYCNEKRASHAIHIVKQDISLPLNAELTVQLIDEDYRYNEEKIYHDVLTHATDNSYRYRGGNLEEIFVINKAVINGETYFSLTYCPLNVAYDYVNDTKELLVRKTDNVIIFSENEIVHIRDGRRSAASFANSYVYYYSNPTKYIAGDDSVANEFCTFLSNLCKKHISCVPFCDGNIEGFEGLKFNILDDLKISLKECSPRATKVNKKDLMIQDIVNSLQTPPTYTDKEKYVLFKVTEKDDLNRTISGEFTCPYCGVVTTIREENAHYFSNADNFRECAHCHHDFNDVSLVNLTNLGDNRKLFCVIQDYENGLIIRTLYFKPVLTNGKMVYIPEDIDNKGDNIVIINKQGDSLLETLSFITFNHEKGKYTFKKEFSSLGHTSFDHILIDANNMNIRWSGIEMLFRDSVPYYSKGKYDEVSIIKFLTLYQKYPVLEQLLKAGYKNVIYNILSSYDWHFDTPSTLYDLSQKDIASALRVSKGCLKYLSNMNRNSFDDFRFLQALYLVDNNISEEDFKYIVSQNLSPYVVVEICKDYGLTTHQICEYIERVRINQCVVPNTAISEWRDYLSAIKTIGSDLSDRKVKYPAALRTEHDKVVYKKKIIENANFEANFKKITKEYGDKYSYVGSDYIITYPKTLNDLFEEGRMLNHCVGTYGDAIKDGRSIILFVRKKKTPNNPYFTLEVNPVYNSVNQFLGFNDQPPKRREDKELIDFVKEWAFSHGISF